MSAAESFESDPTKLIVLFNPGDRSNLVAYWVTLHSLARLEREFDQRASAGRWREITDDYQQERLIAATIPQIHMLLSRFRDLRLRLRPKDAPVIATADDPATGIYVLGITAVDESLQLHLTQFHSKACGVDTNQEGSKPCGRPFVLVGNGWKIPSFAFLDDAWTMVSEGSLDAAELSVRMRDLIERHGNGYSGAAIARFPPGVDGLLMDWWLEQHPPASGSGWGGGNAKRYNPFNIWNPVGPTKDPLLNGVIGR